MKVLQDKGVPKKGATTGLHKHIKILANEQEQDKGAVLTPNQEVKELKEKLEEEGHKKKKE